MDDFFFVILFLVLIAAVPIVILVQISAIKRLLEEWIDHQKSPERSRIDRSDSTRLTEPDRIAGIRPTKSPQEPPPIDEKSRDLPNADEGEGTGNVSPPESEPPAKINEEKSTAPKESTRKPGDTPRSKPIPPIETPRKKEVRQKTPSAFETATRESLRKIKNWILVGEENAPTQGTMENALASQWLMRIGILLLFAGAAYLMKFSIDNNLITPTQRIYTGLITGLGLIIASHKIREGQFTLLRYGLMGAGVGILYIASLAATSLYQLIPDLLGYVAIAAVSTIAGFLSYRHQSLFLAVVGILGAYTTPLVIGINSGSATTSQYYAYLFFVTAGTLFVCSRRDWPVLILTSFVLHWAQVIYLLEVVEDSQWTQVLSFTIAYCIGFSTISFARHLRLGTTTTFIDMMILTLNAAAYTVCVSYLIPMRHDPIIVAVATGGAAIFYALHAWICWKTRRLDYPIFQLFCLLSGFFALMTLPKLISTAWITSTWSLAGLCLLILADRTKNGLMGRIGLSLLLIGVIRLLLHDLPEWYSSSYWATPYVSGMMYLWSFLERAIGVILPVGSMIYASILFIRHQPIPDFEKSGSPFFLGSGFFSILRIFSLALMGSILLIHLLNEIPLIPSGLKDLLTVAIWVLLGMQIINVLFFNGASSRIRTFFDYSSAGVGVAVLLWLFSDHDSNIIFGIITNDAMWPFIAIPAGVIAAIPLLNPKILKPAIFLGVAAFASIYWSTTEEAYRLMEYLYPGMKDGAKTIVMILNAIGLLVLGLKHNRSIIRKAGLLLIGISILKMYFHDLQSLKNIYRVLSLVFIGLLLMAGSALYLKAQAAMAKDPIDEGGGNPAPAKDG